MGFPVGKCGPTGRQNGEKSGAKSKLNECERASAMTGARYARKPNVVQPTRIPDPTILVFLAAKAN